MSYFGNIKRGIKTTAKGMSLTLKHFANARFSRSEKQIQNDDYFELHKGHVTVQYPHQTLDIPDHGRNQLDCEIDDCIVCDKCAKVCPVDCIDIEAIKSPELIRTTSDGSPVRLHAAKFDIDMAKCCFCGLCTTVCPTECLTHTSEFDFPVIDVTQLNFAFSNLTEEVAQEKRDLYDQFVEEKAALKAEQLATKQVGEESAPKAKPMFRPGMKSGAKPRPVFKPTVKPVEEGTETKASKPRPIFKPTTKPKTDGTEAKVVKPRPIFKPTAKPKADETEAKVAKPRPVFKPSIKPKADETGSKATKPRPIFKPSQKPKSKTAEIEGSIKKPVFVPKQKPVAKVPFRPTLKPKKD